MFVVQCIEYIQDSSEEQLAKIVETREEAVAFIEKMANGFCGTNMMFRVFELGKEIPVHVTEEKKRKPVEYETRRIAKLG